MNRERIINLAARPGPQAEFRYFGHVPYNKRRWEVEKSTAILRVQDCPVGPTGGEPWVEIQLTESTQAKGGGRFSTRMIGMTLSGEDRAALIAMLTGEKATSRVRETEA